MNQIHPTAIIGKGVNLGINNSILAYTILEGPLEIGNNNIIGPNVIIGSPGQDTRKPRYDSSNCPIAIGNNNIIREFSAIQKPAYGELTFIGDDVFIMQSVHVPHDATIENKVVLTPMVTMGGLVRVMEGANVGMGANIHQKSVIGQYSIVATGSSVLKNVKPFSRHIPGKPVSVNKYAINKYDFSNESNEIEEYVMNGTVPKSNKIKKLVALYAGHHKASERKEY